MYLVAASGTIGLGYREDVCRLEFSACVAMGGGGGGMENECGSRVPYTIYRHKASSLSLYAEIAHHDSLCP